VRVLYLHLRAVTVAALLATATLVAPLAQSQEPVDLDAVYRIKEEGLQRSQVMDTLSHLTDVYGSRLTNSPQIRAAAAWAQTRLTEWGLHNVRQETWGPFGRGWSNERLVAHVVLPTPYPVVGFPRAWTPGTDGPVTADVVMAVIEHADEFGKWSGKLRGKIVLAARPSAVRAHFQAPGRRYTEGELAEMEQQPVTAARATPYTPPTGGQFIRDRMRFFTREGVVAVLEPGSGRGDHGSVLVTGPSPNRDPKEPPTAPHILLATEHYGRIARTVERNVPVRMELDVRNRFHDETLDAFNVVAEIPGTDKAADIVMLGAHFDSWHSGTGATDNAAGSAAMMEAMRILKSAGLKMRRTVRLALWTGEEQGLLGSREYVRQQFGDRDTMALKPAHANLSVYFNMDNGTGAIRGVYLQGNEAVRPIFSAWLEPFRSVGMTTLTIRNTGSTDHVPFDDIGLPGFQFIQDPIEYGTHSHHSSMDLYERVQSEDLMKNATIIASFVYHAANRESLLPRKPLPQPRKR